MQASDFMIVFDREESVKVKDKENPGVFVNKTVFKGNVLIDGMPDMAVVGWLNRKNVGTSEEYAFFFVNEDVPRGADKNSAVQITVKPFNVRRKKDTADWFASSLLVEYKGLAIPMRGDIEGAKPNRSMILMVDDPAYGQKQGMNYKFQSNYTLTNADEGQPDSDELMPF